MHFLMVSCLGESRYLPNWNICVSSRTCSCVPSDWFPSLQACYYSGWYIWNYDMELANWREGYFNNAGGVIKFYWVPSIYIGLPVELVIFLNLVLTTILIPGHIFIILSDVNFCINIACTVTSNKSFNWLGNMSRGRRVIIME